MKIKKSDTLKSLKLKLGEELDIELDENPTTGYRWYQKEGGDSSIIALKRSSHEVGGNKGIGSGGKRIIKLVADSRGKQKLKWVYWQEWNGEASIEDVMLALGKIKGDAKKGKQLFTSQGCVACHSLTKEEVMKGPFMGQVGSIMNKEQIAESILKPNASISQGFSTVQIKTKDGKNYVGFVTEESADELTIRNIVGTATELKISDIDTRKELETSMMPAGLANSLSYEEMASLVEFLKQQK